MDVYALAITIYILENNYNEQDKTFKSPERIFYSTSVNQEIIKIIQKIITDTDWIKNRNLEYVSNDGKTFVGLIKSMIDSNRKKRPKAAKVASILRGLASGESDTFSKKATRLFSPACFQRKIRI